MTHMDEPDITAVILAGGSSRRFADAGHPTDKLALTHAGQSLLTTVIESARATCPHIIVVGPDRPDVRDVHFVREEPAGGGPVAALAAALPRVSTHLIAFLAGDAPRGPLAIPGLVSALADTPSADGVHVVTDRAQYLCGVYRTLSLQAQIAALASVEAAALHTLLADLTLVTVADKGEWSRDVDTPADARALGYG